MERFFEISVVPLDETQLEACAVMAATAPDPWRKSAFENALTDENRHCFVAVSGGEPVAFASFMLVCGSADLELVAVGETFRRRGVGALLLTQAFALLRGKGALRVLLEVRVGNKDAIALYQKVGFKALACRPNMYNNPREDGFLMALELGKAGRDNNEETL